MTLGERIRSLHRARALSLLDLDSDSDCIGLDWIIAALCRASPQSAATCRRLSSVGSGYLGLQSRTR